MSDRPRISVVTSSYNQGRFIGRTIESVLAQQYPDLEHIVVDGLSKDETPEVLARYPHLVVIREKDSGQADAINKGFRRATGLILCFLNSDDTLEPGALERVAREIDPAAGRQVVMGRCRFIDEDDRFIGVEHPSAFESHRRVLEIWKGYCIPQPAVFWTREVWERSGPLDEREQLVLDYDLFCRMSRDYRFHTFDQAVANYRLHAQSKTQGADDQTRLVDAVRISRRYWPPAWTLEGAGIRLSWARHRLDRRGRAWRLLQAGTQHWREGHRAAAVPPLLGGALLGPEVALAGAAAPLARRAAGPARLLTRLVSAGAGSSAQTQAWRGFTELHSDGWAGPRLERTIDRPEGGDQVHLHFQGMTAAEAMRRPLVLTLRLGDGSPRRVEMAADGTFAVRLPMHQLAPGAHRLIVEANQFFVPDVRWGNGDARPLSFRVLRLEVVRSDS